MQEKDIKRIVIKQLKTKFPFWRNVSMFLRHPGSLISVSLLGSALSPSQEDLSRRPWAGESDWRFADKAFRMHGVGSLKNFLASGNNTIGEAVMDYLRSQ